MVDSSKIKSEVLIVEDLKGTREILKTMLREIGYIKIEEACDGIEALERLKTHTVNLIISDFDMKHMTGLEFLFAVRANPETKNLPFIMLSGKSEPHVIDSVQKEGQAHFLYKPIDFTKLEQKVHELIRRRMAD